MPCSICQHPQAAAIAAAVSRGDSLRQIGAAYGVDKSSLSRHTRQCLTAVSVAPQAGTTPPSLGQYHAEAQRLYHDLTTSTTPLDARQVGVAVVRLLVQMTEPKSRLE